MLRKWILALAAFLIPLAAAIAQNQEEAHITQMTLSDGNSFSMGFQGPPQWGDPVRGMPYSAEELVERSQTLANGSHFQQPPRTAKCYRDSAGRTRTERPFNIGRASFEPPVVIDIRDPDAGYEYVLDDQKHVVHRVKLTVRTGQASETGKPTAATWRNGGMTSTQERLGTQTMEGVDVDGWRVTTVIEAGTQGNDAPATTIHEYWFSPQVGRYVLAKISDPIHGDSTTRLTNIVLADPDPGLFQLPADYQVIDETGPFQIRYTRPARQ